MKLPAELERIKLPKKDKDALIGLKRRTGIGQWNVLCRWAFLLSLAEPKKVHDREVTADSNVEMGWKTFGGEHDQLCLHLLVERCLADGLPTDGQTLSRQFRLHLNRGISHLASTGKIKSVGDLLELALSPDSS